jgi:hypothetical protein
LFLNLALWVKPTGTGSSSYHMVMNKESAYELWITEGYWNYALNGTGGWYGWGDGWSALHLDPSEQDALFRCWGGESMSLVGDHAIGQPCVEQAEEEVVVIR